MPVVVTCVGTDGRPAGPDRARAALAEAGAEVHLSNAGATRRALDCWERCRDPPIVSVGADLLADAIESQAAAVDRVDWRPPMAGTEADLATVATDPLRADANARALAAVLGVQATLVDVRPPPRCSVSSPASSCTPDRRSRGTAPPARCAAR